MSSTFFGLSIAGSGLRAANAAMNTTANNISNSDTAGYSRQQVVQQAAESTEAAKESAETQAQRAEIGAAEAKTAQDYAEGAAHTAQVGAFEAGEFAGRAFNGAEIAQEHSEAAAGHSETARQYAEQAAAATEGIDEFKRAATEAKSKSEEALSEANEVKETTYTKNEADLRFCIQDIELNPNWSGQGGDDFEKYDLDALKYIYDIDKPVLGICLGMQLMGVLFDGYLIDINNHKKILSYVHSVKINRNSKAYNIFKKDIIKVNSRHKSVVKNTKLKVSGISNDGYIEIVEDSNKKFFIGVQWHPENMIEYDDIQKNIYKYFIKNCK